MRATIKIDFVDYSDYVKALELLGRNMLNTFEAGGSYFKLSVKTTDKPARLDRRVPQLDAIFDKPAFLKECALRAELNLRYKNANKTDI